MAPLRMALPLNASRNNRSLFVGQASLRGKPFPALFILSFVTFLLFLEMAVPDNAIPAQRGIWKGIKIAAHSSKTNRARRVRCYRRHLLSYVKLDSVSKFDIEKTAVHMARNPTKKGARADVRYRPRKSRPSLINTKPTPYTANLQSFEGAPPEYTALPCPEVMEILQSEKVMAVLRALQGKPNEGALAMLNNDAIVLHQISRMENYAQTLNDSIALKIVKRLKLALETHGKAAELNPLHSFEIIQNQWNLLQEQNYMKILQAKTNQLKMLYFRMKKLGSSNDELMNPDLWERYDVFKDLPKTDFVEKYIMAHSKEWSYRGNESTEAAVVNALKKTGMLIEGRMGGLIVNYSRLTELRGNNETLQELVSIKDFYFKNIYPDYEIVLEPRRLEGFLQAEYRKHSLVEDLLSIFKKWVCDGSKMKTSENTSKSLEGYKILSEWKSLPKKTRKRVTAKYHNATISKMLAVRRNKKEKLPSPAELLAPTEKCLYIYSPSNAISPVFGVPLCETPPQVNTLKILASEPSIRKPMPSLKKPPMQTASKPVEDTTLSPKKDVEDVDMNFTPSESVSDGHDGYSSPSAQVVVYDDATYVKDEFIHSLLGEIPKMTSERASQLWNNVKMIGKVVVAQFSDISTAECVAMQLRRGTPKIWADVEEL
ncbi:hypothetical protein IE077_000054 [Cardiosporidium cionae]|uniref:Uncharacterized protein n=1 Tax=Cardiosporidium cionae TaxID=476202 RepID=A0ABQ7JH16_9APIC|nr:hypothetical protein IE077_000054 [Cardiosporidium cionae]|eukprot:KAF8823045.1 hypothetical protein IE077_000054 [Cardiosporidium cionae]